MDSVSILVTNGNVEIDNGDVMVDNKILSLNSTGGPISFTFASEYGVVGDGVIDEYTGL